MGDLSPHFDRSEFADKVTGALPDGMPDPSLVERLEIMRAYTGPITVVSGYNDPARNAEIGRAAGTPIYVDGKYVRMDPDTHNTGKASDVWWVGFDPVLGLEWAKAAGFTGIGTYRAHLHVDVRDGDLATWISDKE